MKLSRIGSGSACLHALLDYTVTKDQQALRR